MLFIFAVFFLFVRLSFVFHYFNTQQQQTLDTGDENGNRQHQLLPTVMTGHILDAFRVESANLKKRKHVKKLNSNKIKERNYTQKSWKSLDKISVRYCVSHRLVTRSSRRRSSRYSFSLRPPSSLHTNRERQGVIQDQFPSLSHTHAAGDVDDDVAGQGRRPFAAFEWKRTRRKKLDVSQVFLKGGKRNIPHTQEEETLLASPPTPDNKPDLFIHHSLP